MKFFLWVFYLFETRLGFVFSIKCSDTLLLTFFRGWACTAASWLWLWDRTRDLAKNEIQRSLKNLKFQAQLGPVQIWFSWLLDSECKPFKMLIKWYQETLDIHRMTLAKHDFNELSGNEQEHMDSIVLKIHRDLK